MAFRKSIESSLTVYIDGDYYVVLQQGDGEAGTIRLNPAEVDLAIQWLNEAKKNLQLQEKK